MLHPSSCARLKRARTAWNVFGRVFLLAAFLVVLLPNIPADADVQYATTDDWGSGFNGQLTVTNTNSQALSAWAVEFDCPQTLSGFWNGALSSHVGAHYILKSAGWNDTIAPGGKVVIGFGGAPGHVTAGPANLVLHGTLAGTAPPVTPPILPPVTPPVAPPAASGLQVIITQTGSWSGGFGANLDIVNGTKASIANWTLALHLAPAIQSLWNGTLTAQNGTDTIGNAGWNGTIAPGAKATVGFTGAGTLTLSSATSATVNGTACPVTIVLGTTPTPTNPTGSAIVVGGGADTQGEARQVTVAQGMSQFPLSLSGGGTGTFTVAVNNPAVVSAQIAGSTLQLNGLAAGRAGLRLTETQTGTVRYLGVRVRTATGALPGLPAHVALGSVSEDTDPHLAFWHGFGTGAQNRFVDARYIYLNGGPYYGWSTWTSVPGDRAVSYIQQSQRLGMTPIFVWYNIPDGGESYYTDMQHVQSASYMKDYYLLLEQMLQIVKAQSPDDPIGIILEPDFLGYLAQNAGLPAAQIAAQTQSAYDSGVLTAADPRFPNTVQGIVQSINYLIARDAPQAFFGWQMNLWASPAGGWTTPIPGTGIVHLTDTGDMTTGRTAIYNEATAITRYYLNAGIASYGAKFVSIDKYGLDAGTAEASAAQNPAGSTWFWNADQWNNYLVFVRAMHDTSSLPVVLWQLPVGHINHSLAADPYLPGGVFPDLLNASSQGEDSAPTFFFGDTFTTNGNRLPFFSANRGGDAGVSAANGTVTWGRHMDAAADAGVTMLLFGAGVGGSTTNIGTPPTDSFWWISKAQGYLQQPVALPGH